MSRDHVVSGRAVVTCEPKANERPPFFIVGPGRSGTTLMARLLSAHSRLTVAPETHYLKRAVAGGAAVDEGPRDYDDFWAKYTQWSRFMDLEVDADRCVARIDALGVRSFRNIFAGVLSTYGESLNKARVGEKTPGHVRFMDRLLAWFPDTRFIVMVRDPRAVVASQLRSPWVRIRPPSLRRGVVIDSRAYQTVRYAVDWKEIYDIARAWKGHPQVIVQPYEDLVRSPHHALSQICDFLGEDFEPEMLEGVRDAERIPPGTAAAYRHAWGDWLERHHQRANQSISLESLEKWRNQLTKWEVAAVEGVCGGRMREQGYELTASSVARAAGRLTSFGVELVHNLEYALRKAARR